MGRCTFPNCSSTNQKGRTLFRFPRDEDLKNRWLRAIGRPSWSPYREARLCELHFSPTQWNRQTLRLLPSAVPLSSPLSCTCGQQQISPKFMEDHCYATRRDENCKVHGLSSSSLGKKNVSDVLSENCRLQNEVHELRQRLQATKHKENITPKRPKFDKEDIKNGLQLRFACGSTGYRKVVELQGNTTALPSVRTLQRSTENIKFAPGVLNEILTPLKGKFLNYSDLRDCDINIIFDELATKKRIEYDASLKCFIGHGTLPGQENLLAEKGEIYVFRGVHQKLKQVVAYHLNPAKVDSAAKKEVILELLRKAKDINANVISIVCDMGNRGLLSALGFSTAKDSLKWCIQNPVKPEAKLWCVPDPVHVFKSAKESFCNNKFFELPQRIVVEYGLPSSTVNVEHIEWLENFQKSDSLQLVPGLTIKDLHCNHFSKMKVRSSVKVFNPRTAAALQYLSVKGLVPESFETTAWFVRLMNRWFQLMTSRNLQFALGLKNKAVYEEAIEHLKLVIFVFKYIKITGGWKPVQSHIIFATNAVLEIQKYLLQERGYDFVRTSAFSTDCVENINSGIRIVNPNPSPLEFKNRLKLMAIAQFHMKIARSSYDFDDSKDFVDLLSYIPTEESNQRTLTASFQELKWVTDFPCSSSYQDDVLYRLCGYIIISLKKKRILSCDGCIQMLKHCEATPHPNATFLIMTDFVPGAQFPVSDVVFQLFKLIENNLMSWVPLLQYAENLDKLIELVVQPGCQHISLPTCHNVRERLVRAFTVMRFRQIAVNHFSPTENLSSTSLSSKTAGSFFLAQNFKLPSKKLQETTPKSKPLHRLKRLF